MTGIAESGIPPDLFGTRSTAGAGAERPVDRDAVADARDAVADVREEAADARAAAADVRDATADIREALSREHDLDVAALLARAADRDATAADRDAAAQERDAVAERRVTVLPEVATAERALARTDRRYSGQDRDASATDRTALSSPVQLATLSPTFAAAPVAMALMSVTGRWLKVNPALCALTGTPEQELLGSHFRDITHPDDLDGELQWMHDVLDGLCDGYELEKRYLRPDSCVVWVALAASLVRTTVGQPSHFIVQMMDVTTRKLSQEQLLHQAEHDPLTGLWNRWRLQEEVQRCVVDMARHLEPCTLLLMDLDGFKAVNDLRGHHAGDTVLVNVAHALSSVLRESDCGARLGGDEFALVLPRTSEAQGALVAARVLAAVAAAAGDTGVRASIGLASLEQDMTVQKWLQNADAAMYLAKRSGGNKAMTHRVLQLPA